MFYHAHQSGFRRKRKVIRKFQLQPRKSLDDGKIPRHQRWASRIAIGERAIDTLLNLAGLASFAANQAHLDERIVRIVG
jgi:hypothetical protein